MQITKAKEIEDQVMLRPAVVQKYYNITASSIYRWQKEEEAGGDKAPIKISRPKNSKMTFVEHDSIIDYFNHGFHENSTL
tara:strand:+ start:176 stop:415 length:240 start_codon:yes stop_codon:yes gene_type:complete